MRLLIQRVKEASVRIEGMVYSQIGQGLLAFLAVAPSDTEKDVSFLSGKLLHLRCFADEAGKMNKSVQDIKGEILLVSQFTLYADCLRGRRPDLFHAARPEISEPLYEKCIAQLNKSAVSVKTGKFGVAMDIALINDGPATFLIDSPSIEQ